MKRLKNLIITLCIIFSLFIPVKANTTTNLHIHKLRYSNEATLPSVQNTGSEMLISEFGADAELWDNSLYGYVEFKLYKLNESLLPTPLNPTAVAQAVEDAVLAEEPLPYGATEYDHLATGSNGSLTFANASASIYEGVVFDLYKDDVLVDGSRQTTSTEGTLSVTGLTVGNYHFVEVSNPDNMPIYEGLNSTSFATNILSFVYNADGTITYPNHSIFSDSSHIVVNYPLPEIAKEQVTTAADNSVDIGETINYKITVQIPHNISEYTSFKVEDFLDKAFLSPNASSIAFSANVTFNPTVNTTFSGSGVAKWLEITFAISDLEALAGQEVEITYSAKLLQAAVAATDYSNRAGLPLNYYNINETPSQSVSVVTYDHKIAKIGKSLFNADNNNIPLAGAEFVIEKLDNGIAVYLVQDAQGEISWDSNMGNATRFETDSFGVVVIHGLGTGDYTAIEVTAPTGYNLPLIPRTNFTVSAHALGTPGETSINNWEIVDLPMTGTIMTAAVVGGLSTLVGTALYFVIVKKDDEDEE